MKYRPSNGTAGMDFDDRWCSRCARDAAWRADENEEPCDILSRTFVHKVDDPEYPAEWTYDAAGRPCCTAFVPDGDALDLELEAARTDPRQTTMF